MVNYFVFFVFCIYTGVLWNDNDIIPGSPETIELFRKMVRLQILGGLEGVSARGGGGIYIGVLWNDNDVIPGSPETIELFRKMV